MQLCKLYAAGVILARRVILKVRTVRAAGYRASHLTKVREAMRATRLSAVARAAGIANQKDRGAVEPHASLSRQQGIPSSVRYSVG